MLPLCASAALGLALVAHLAYAQTLPTWSRQPQPEPLLRPPTFGDDDAPAADPRVTLCTLVSVRLLLDKACWHPVCLAANARAFELCNKPLQAIAVRLLLPPWLAITTIRSLHTSSSHVDAVCVASPGPSLSTEFLPATPCAALAADGCSAFVLVGLVAQSVHLHCPRGCRDVRAGHERASVLGRVDHVLPHPRHAPKAAAAGRC